MLNKTSIHSARRFFGLRGCAGGWVVSQLAQKTDHITVVCPDEKTCTELLADCSFFLDPQIQLSHFTGWDTLPFEYTSPQLDVTAHRIHILHQLLSCQRSLVITSVEALAQRTLPPRVLTELTLTLEQSTEMKREALLKRLLWLGFTRAPMVESIGEFSVRGSVIDVFPAGYSRPIRIQFSGDKVEELRHFNIENQRSINQLSLATITPIRESAHFHSLPWLEEQLPQAIDRLKTRAQEIETPSRELAKAIDTLRTGANIPGVELLFAIAFPQLATVFDFIPPSSNILLWDSISIHQQLDSFQELVNDRATRLKAEHYLIPEVPSLFLPSKELEQQIDSFSVCHLDHLEVLDDHTEEESAINLKSVAHTRLVTELKTDVGSGQALEPLKAFVNTTRKQNIDVLFVVGSESRMRRLQRLLLDLGLDAPTIEYTYPEWHDRRRRYPLAIIKGHLSSGVTLPDENVALIAEEEIFHERSYRQSQKPSKNLKRLLGSLAQLQEGDFVVHIDYGIGIYRGLTHVTLQETESDLIHIEYADTQLYLPVQNIRRIQKFVASEGKAPTLDKLSSNRWKKTKRKVRESVETLAGDLIKLYAKRSVAKGWQFEPIGAEDERFADGFGFQETPDQGQAIEATLNDMASNRPMDRLVCGDVGFGKTEVAIRAAFKCLQHARQVAVLVPTTVLVEQHRQSFVERFRGYPYNVAAVSRFYSSAQNKETLQALSDGKVDLIIGTHRLLSKDVTFRDLGLLVIDEEHRFGVKQKEKLKQFKHKIDVLTLTATPIPRTLHMSLLGIRDISIISTPPHDRRVIRTYVANFGESLVRDAIMREHQRKGQCFFVHNRVQSIEAVTARLRALVPECRFAFGHGQMSETQLENIMQQFIEHKVDVLVSTTIIESGLDIANANTIIMDRADMFGLAQLYQLRGRVGRSTRQAYAYLLVPKAQKLSNDVQKRLKALQALDDLGHGFQLAIRDMEIRGAGNLLGKQQSGSVLAVGFELYSKILKEAIEHLRGDELVATDSVDPEVKLRCNAYIPETYVPDISERLILYQRLADLKNDDEALSIREEFEDRFGPYGKEVENLLDVMQFRALLREYGVVLAEATASKIVLSFSPNAPIDGEKMIKLVKAKPKEYKFGKNHSLTIVRDGVEDEQDDPKVVQEEVRGVLRAVGRE